jgi:TonB-dependent receptor
MSIPSRLLQALLVTTALVAPTGTFAQSTDASSAPAATPTTGEQVAQPAPVTPAEQAAAAASPEAPQEAVDVSVPGEIVVTGRRDRDIGRTSAQVVSVLGAAEIARTGEGNIAGALNRVTGLSVVGSGFVFVRGLGDRYSLALLNGSPLPSPEPLRRVVPLDIFPSGIIASSLVQKSYSVNYPGEFGGGVINLTTRAVPRESFLTIGAGISGDTETTGNLGYTYYGSKSDDTGFGNGQRDIPPALAAFFASGARISDGTVNTQAIAAQLVNGRNGIVQRWGHVAPNASANLTGGTSFDVGAGTLGLIVAGGYSNKYVTREATQQTSLTADLSTIETSFRQVNTDQRIVVNGLVGLGYEWDNNKIRWTNLFVRDTIKQARLSIGNRQQTTVDYLQQRTAWFARQLFDSQLVNELSLADNLKLDIRAGYARSQRDAPSELFFEYVRTNSAADPYGQYFVNRLNNGNGGDARITYSRLDEDLYSAGADLTWQLVPDISATVGGAWSDTKRRSSRRDFQFQAPSSFPTGIGLFRPDLLLQPSVINFYKIALVETDEGNPAFFARLRNYAGYAKVNAKFAEFTIDAGVRYENGLQSVDAIRVFNIPGATVAKTNLEKSYWLPAATITWQPRNEIQVRLNGSKTIARPQFRELINQPFFDPESNRTYRGNPLLVDSQLYNAELRGEYYFAPEQRLSVSAFFKRINNPIEAFITGGDVVTSFANAPKANLYGAEVELQKYFDLSFMGDGDFWGSRRAVLTGNYTYTKSELKVKAGDTVRVFGASSSIATDYFRNGRPLTGQSNHIANLQIGLEQQGKLSQQTFLLNYASDRVVSRGLNGSTPQPDVIERPGFTLDFVARQGIDLFAKEVELKFEARNITGRKHQEFQQSGSNRIDVNTYKVGTTLALSASIKL